MVVRFLSHPNLTDRRFSFLVQFVQGGIHLAFGCDLINTIKEENEGVWTPDLQKKITDLIVTAVDQEKKYAFDACPNGLLGINPQQFGEYV